MHRAEIPAEAVEVAAVVAVKGCIFKHLASGSSHRLGPFQRGPGRFFWLVGPWGPAVPSVDRQRRYSAASLAALKIIARWASGSVSAESDVGEESG